MISVFIAERGRVTFQDVEALKEHELAQAKLWQAHYARFAQCSPEALRAGHAAAAASWAKEIIRLESWLKMRRALNA
jgi:hypothetical protein